MSTALLNLLFAQTIYKYAAEGNASVSSIGKKKSTSSEDEGPSTPPDQFVRLAEELKTHPLNTNFHLSPQACQSLYNALLPNTPGRPTVDMLEPLLSKLFESYKRDVTQQIKREEQEYSLRLKDIEDIGQGKCDTELLRDYEHERKNSTSSTSASASQQQQLQQLRLQKQLELQQKQEQERKIQLQKQALQKQKQLERQQMLIKQEQQQKNERQKQLKESPKKDEEGEGDEDDNEKDKEEEDVEMENVEEENVENVKTKIDVEGKGVNEASEDDGEEEDEDDDDDEDENDGDREELDKEKEKEEPQKGPNRGRQLRNRATESEVQSSPAEAEDDADEEPSGEETEDEKKLKQSLKRKRVSVSPGFKRFQQLTTPLLSDIMSNKSASFFSHPVNPNDAPNYYNLIKSPADLRTIKAMVRTGELRNSALLERELQKMFANSIMYNDWNSDVSQLAREMQKDTDTLLTLFRGAERGSTPVGEDDRKRRKK